jgi:diguanylate cyclase (GGDEF)-like protein
MNRLMQTENWLSKRMWWGLISLVLTLTLSFQALFFFLQYRDVQLQTEHYQSELIQSEFKELQAHLTRELNLIKKSLDNRSFQIDQTLDRLREQRFGLENRGYFFVLQLHDIQGGEAFAEHLLLPIDPAQEGVPMSSAIEDEQGFAYREAYLEQLREKGEAKVSYWYRKPDSEFSAEKTSYIYLIPELNWVLGAGLYLDDFNSAINQFYQKQQNSLIERASWSIGVSLVLVFIALFVMRHYQLRSMRRLRKLHQQVADFQKEIVNYSQRLQLDVEKKAKQLENMYQFDSLTQVLNRTRLNQDIQLLAPDEAAIMVNVDGFKEINEIFGNDIGDIILRELAYKLKHRFNNGRVYRLNADVFVVIFTPSSDESFEADLVSLHYHLVHDRLPQFDDHDVEYNVTVVATREHENTLSRLEMTMLYAKAKRLNTLCYRDEFDYAELYRSNLHITHEIRTAIEQDRVRPVFQAIRDMKTNEVTHYECLIRIEEPDGHMVPADFLLIAQKSKLYPDLMQIMLRKSFEAFANSDINFSINLSYEDIISQDIRNTIFELLDDENAPRVIFEILESEGIENYPEVSKFIRDVKARGCKVAIDDFGTGYSNFEHVLKLHVDYIKLDGTLIEALLTSQDAQYVVESVVYFAKRVGLKVIAEFVSEPELIEKVRSLGVDYAQGYAIGYPSTNLHHKPQS